MTGEMVNARMKECSEKDPQSACIDDKHSPLLILRQPISNDIARRSSCDGVSQISIEQAGILTSNDYEVVLGSSW